ncbi:MAG TPA: MFS transporter [Casimicrobiaceae bacterium]|nr:MFS transporter [Casimicrobiaceae bacterium]
MTAADDDARTPGRARAALAATLAIQVYTSLAATAVSVLATEIAPAFGVSTKLVGVFIGIMYVGSMAASLAAGGFIGRFGAIRVSQACVLLSALGLALLPLAAPWTGALLLAMVAPLVIGLGYGPITPASSQVLARTAPPSRMALTFSIKQTGVPAGAALAGAVLPTLALAAGWSVALAAVASAGVVVAVLAQRVRADLDHERHRTREASAGGAFAVLKDVFADPRLAEITVLSFFYSATQVALTSFLVVFLAEQLGYPLVTAGAALSVATIAGVSGRLLWGHVADLTGSPRAVLAGLGAAAGLCAFATAAWPAGTSAWPLFVVLALFGVTAIGWNGVMLAEVARLSPPGRAGAITGGTGFVTFAGVVVGPSAFSLLAGLFGSYRAGFVAIGLGSLAAALVLALRLRAGRPGSGPT